MAERAVHVEIHGRVQGVWFRGWMKQEADGLALNGWVRNRRDGTVEAVLAGDADALDRMVEKCRAGPPLARVADIRVVPADFPKERGFVARPTV